MTLTDRQRELYQDMRAEGKHLLDRPEGWYRNSTKTDVRKTWALYQDVQPKREREEA